MKSLGILTLTAALLGAASPRPAGPTADVTAVSVVPATGRAELLIDVSGVVEVSDFVLREPTRLVVDLVGARLVAPLIRYDGVARGGVRDIRYAQFRPDVVRVVVDLDGPRDYEIRQEESAIRVALEGQGESDFASWSSGGRSAPAFAAPAGAAAARELPAAIPARQAPAAQATQQPRVSVTFDQASIHDVVANFAEFSGRSMVVGKDVSGTVSAEIRNQPWDVAFNAILAGQGLTAVEDPGGIIRIDTRANLATRDSLEPLTTRIVRINYARASSLQPSVQGIISGRGRAVADTVNNAIIVTDASGRIATIDSFIQALDVRTPQVAIQARIVFVDRTELEDLGLRYDLGQHWQFFNQLIPRTAAPQPFGPVPASPAATTYDPAQTVVSLGGNTVAAIANASAALANGNPALEVILTTAIGNFAITAFIEALQSTTLADIQAEPSVTVADNRTARIFSGERTPVRQIDVGAIGGGGAAAPRATTTFQQTGITLNVTPHVVQNTREVLMEIHAERSTVTPSPISEIGAVFSSQEATTQLLVRDGETAVIGGLTVTEVTETRSGIPFLVNLPVVGQLFGFTSNKEVRRDLLILVTPHIVDDMSTGGAGGQNR